MTHVISWFKIPAPDLERAQRFYGSIFGIRLIPMDLPNAKMSMFPDDAEIIDTEANRIGLHSVPQ